MIIFPETDYNQALQAIAEKHGADVSRLATNGPPDGDLSVFCDGKLIGTLSYEFDHNAPEWDKNYIKTDWTFKAIEK